MNENTLKTTEEPETYQELFSYLNKELNVIAVDTEMYDIVEICRRIIKKEIY